MRQTLFKDHFFTPEGKYAIKWTRLMQIATTPEFHALANLGNFRTLALPKEVEPGR